MKNKMLQVMREIANKENSKEEIYALLRRSGIIDENNEFIGEYKNIFSWKKDKKKHKLEQLPGQLDLFDIIDNKTELLEEKTNE